VQRGRPHHGATLRAPAARRTPSEAAFRGLLVAGGESIHTRAALDVAAPVEEVFDVYADYSRWQEFFTTIRGVRLIGRDERGVTLAIDHVEGSVHNHLQLLPPDRIVLTEDKRAYRATFVNTFQKVGPGTRFVVDGKIRLKGARRLVAPFVRAYVRGQILRLQLTPVKVEAERRLAAGEQRGHRPGDA
jgi:hypothetical protein